MGEQWTPEVDKHSLILSTSHQMMNMRNYATNHQHLLSKNPYLIQKRPKNRTPGSYPHTKGPCRVTKLHLKTQYQGKLHKDIVEYLPSNPS